MLSENALSARAVHLVPLVCAALLTLLGVGTLVAWQLGSGGFLFAPSIPAIEGVVAAAFVLSGVALLVLQLGWGRFPAVVGGCVAGLALLVSLQQVLELDLGVDAAVLEGLASARSVAWVSIDPTTLIAFVLAGTTLALLGTNARHAFAGTALGALVATLGVVALLEGSSAARSFEWIGYFHTTTPTAVGLLVVGIGLAAAGLERREPGSEAVDWAAPVAVGVTVALIGAILWQGLRGHELRQLQRILDERTQTISVAVQNSLAGPMAYLDQFPYEPPPAAEPGRPSASPVRQLGGHFPGLRATTWIDLPRGADGSPAQALEGISELGFLEGRYETLLESGGPVLSGPIPLDGGTGFRIVLYRRAAEDSTALITGVISGSSVFASLPRFLGSGLDVVVLCNDEPVFRHGEIRADRPLPGHRRLPLELPGPASWEMIVAPRIDLLDANRSALPEVVLGASLVIALLLTALTRTARVARVRARVLEEGQQGRGAAAAPTMQVADFNRFVATLGHEIRNPLAVIQNVVQVLEGDLPVGVDEERLRAILTRQVDQLAHVMDAVLDLQAEGGPEDLVEMRDLDLGSLIEEVVDAANTRAAREDVVATLKIDEPRVIVKADRELLRRAFHNLLRFSLSRAPAGTSVRVAVEAGDGARATVRIGDRGSGLEPGDAERLLSPFSGLERSVGSRTAEGTLALAAAGRLIELHGGEVSASSEGGGLELRVLLPRT